MKTFPLILLGKWISLISQMANRGNGSTWPGHIALKLEKNFIKNILKQSQTKIILVVGTNGKTTTSHMLATILQAHGSNVFTNASGANLVNGIASSLLLHTKRGKLIANYAIFEVDENSLPLILQELTPTAIIALDLFRDQLDRYGELDSIATKWKTAFVRLGKDTTCILNADDPLIAHLGEGMQSPAVYFGLNLPTKQTQLQHAADSIYCPRCGTKLTYDAITYAHLGHWHCAHCKLKRPTPTLTQTSSPLSGTYNIYNALAAVLTAKELGIYPKESERALKTLTPAFGRQEILQIGSKRIQIFLAKNPAGFNENLETITQLGAKQVLFVLNDRIPDGTDVSWIWDIDLEQYVNTFRNIYVSGDRVYDMGLRVAYAYDKQTENIKTFEKIKIALEEALLETLDNETLYVLPTYSAMLEVRKLVTGKKIL